MFQPKYYSITQCLAEGNKAIYTHVINSNIAFIQVRNNSNELIILDCYAHLEYISECLKEDCYLMKLEVYKLAEKVLTKTHQGF